MKILEAYALRFFHTIVHPRHINIDVLGGEGKKPNETMYVGCNCGRVWYSTKEGQHEIDLYYNANGKRGRK